MTAQKVNADLLETSLVAKRSVGEVHWDSVGRLWQYVKASEAITKYQYVKVSGNGLYTIAPLSTTTNPNTEPASVGCAQVAFANAAFGWVFRGFGYHIGKYAANCVQDVKIYTTGTVGVVDDSATTLVNGLKLITTITSAADSPAWASTILQTVAA
jgi:hypothetical protein